MVRNLTSRLLNICLLVSNPPVPRISSVPLCHLPHTDALLLLLGLRLLPQAALLWGCPPPPVWSPPPYTGHSPAWVPSSPRVGSDASHRAPLSNVQVVLLTLHFDQFFVYLSSPQRSATPPSLDCVQFFLTYCYLFQCQVHRRHSICAYWVHEGRTTWVKALRREGGNGVGADGAETRNRQKGREAKFRSALWDDRGNRLEGDRSVSCFGCTPLAVPQRVH